MPALEYLSTTSLLPAELQLLSVSMINVLIFSSSPQAVILQSLLWLGGLSVFILCSRVLSWGVALARIPSWRFRQPQSKAREGNIIVTAMDNCLNGRLSKWRLTSADSDDSESDDVPRPSNHRISKKHRTLLSVVTSQIEEAEGGTFSELPKTPSQLLAMECRPDFEGPIAQ